MRTPMHLERRLLSAIVAGGLLLAAPAMADSPSLATFRDAANAAVDYAVKPVTPGTACAELGGFSAPGLTILGADIVPAAGDAPEYCRIAGLIAPEVEFRVELPAAWNRRLYMHGNSGSGGEALDAWSQMGWRLAALGKGFVTVMTNTGHDNAREPGFSFAADRHKLVDFGFRAVHETVVAAKGLIEAYYGRGPAFSYWDGCSEGGRQGLMAAQRFPGDFDGIIAGSPPLKFVDIALTGLWNRRAFEQTPLGDADLALVSKAVLGKCDVVDGLEDGLIQDPRQCDFVPARDLPICGAESGGSCLTPAKLATLEAVYGGMRSKGAVVQPGVLPGSEIVGTPTMGVVKQMAGWRMWIYNPDEKPPIQFQLGQSVMRHMSAGAADPGRDHATFDFDKDLAAFDWARGVADADDPDLRAFQQRGGKLLMYFGWADAVTSPTMAIDYYQQALAATGPETPGFFRLFMVPGMNHCRGGVATDTFDPLSAMVSWVEAGQAPERIRAERWQEGAMSRSRPLCPYPRTARYDGDGSINNADNFVCEAP